MKRIIFVILILINVPSVFAQDEWTLEKCINYALENNLTIKQYELNSRYQQNQHQQSKNDRLPNLSAGISQGVNFGRSLTIENTYESFTSTSSNLSANSSVVIWQGGILNNTIKQRSFDYKAAIEELNKAKDDIILNITAVKSMQESFRYIEEKYNADRVNTVEYSNAKTRQAIARSNLLQAKYEFIFRSKILEFYNGLPISL